MILLRRLLLYLSFRRRSPIAPLRRDEVGDVRWERERSLSLCVLPLNNWSPKLLLLLWFFFLLFDFAVCQPPP